MISLTYFHVYSYIHAYIYLFTFLLLGKIKLPYEFFFQSWPSDKVKAKISFIFTPLLGLLFRPSVTFCDLLPSFPQRS